MVVLLALGILAGLFVLYAHELSAARAARGSSRRTDDPPSSVRRVPRAQLYDWQRER